MYWSYDHCLALYPTPDVVIVADKGDAFTTEENKCIVFNPVSIFFCLKCIKTVLKQKIFTYLYIMLL